MVSTVIGINEYRRVRQQSDRALGTIHVLIHNVVFNVRGLVQDCSNGVTAVLH